MKLRAVLMFLIPTLILSCAALAWPEKKSEEREQPVKLADVPKAVQDAIKRLTPAEAITELEKETEDGITVYDVEFKKGGGKTEATLSAGGDVIEIESDVDGAKLPEALRTAIAKKFAKGEVKAAKSVTLNYYRIAVKVGDKVHVVKAVASGQFDDDDDDEHGDDDGDDDDEGDDDEDDDHDGDDD